MLESKGSRRFEPCQRTLESEFCTIDIDFFALGREPVFRTFLRGLGTGNIDGIRQLRQGGYDIYLIVLYFQSCAGIRPDERTSGSAYACSSHRFDHG